MKQNKTTTNQETDLDKIIPEELEKKVQLLNKMGLSPRLIGESLKISAKEVKDILHPKEEKTKISREESYLQKKFQDIEKMKWMRQKGYSVYTIGTTFGIPANDIYPHLKHIKPDKTIREDKRNLSQEDLENLKMLHKEGFRPDQIARFLKCTEIAVDSNLKKLKLK
jgi:hypothetical protein